MSSGAPSGAGTVTLSFDLLLSLLLKQWLEKAGLVIDELMCSQCLEDEQQSHAGHREGGVPSALFL